MSDRGAPYGYRHMNGYGSHTYLMLDDANQHTSLKFHFKTAQGISNFIDRKAAQMKVNDMDFLQHDLMENIDAENFRNGI
jgi:catalase